MKMNPKFYIPACHKYIKTKEGEPNTQRIFSVAKCAYRQKFNNTILKDEELLSFLINNEVVSADITKEQLDLEHIEMCFSIITQYKCNAICQLCGYSPLYRNALENEEAVLLGYALSSWRNLQVLLASGVTCRHFRAVIQVSQKSSVSVVPLNRLAFEYMEKIPKSQEDMLSIADKIVASIKANNQSKLSAADCKIALHYLTNLYNSNFRYMKKDKLEKVLKQSFGLELKAPEEQPENIVPPKNVTTQKEQSHVASVLPSQEESVDDERTEQEQEEKQTDELADKKGKKEQGFYTWQIEEAILKSAPAIDLECADKHQLELFKDHLLITPLLPMELVYVDGKEKIVVYAGEHLYHFDATNPLLLDEMLPYLKCSSYRKILCYEPYQLYAYFNRQQMRSISLFSIRNTEQFLGEKQTANPLDAISSVLRVQIPKPVNALLYCMQHYKKYYMLFVKCENKFTDEEKREFYMKTNIEKLIGVSFVQYYLSKEPVEIPYSAIRFAFSWKDGNFPMEEFLSNCVGYKLFHTYEIYLREYDEESATVVIRNDEQKNVCEALHNLACHMAEAEKKTPIIVEASFVQAEPENVLP